MNKSKDLCHNDKSLLNYKLLILLVLCFVPMVSAAQTWNLHFSDGTTTINATDVCVADGTCLTTSAGGDITAVNTDGPYLSGGAASGAISLLLNASAINLTINDLAVANASWTQALADTLYADISVTGDNSSWNQSLADNLYATAGAGNESFNQTWTDTLYREATWDNFTGIPTATPTNGDTTHLSTADQIYDWVISLAYATASYVESLGNWSAVSSQYWNTSTDIDTVLSADEIAEANIDFSTACSIGDYYRLTGNDLECTTPGTYNSTYGALITDNSSWTEVRADTLYAILGYGDDWNKTYADILYADISVITDNSTWNEVRADTLYADILVITDNSSWSEVRADTLYREGTWDNFTGIPTATPSNGDTTHFSLSGQIYDWAVGLFLQAMDYTNLALTNVSETFEVNVTVERLVFETDVTHTIHDNQTCVILGGSTARFEIC